MKIGVFDSGVGGLSVLKKIKEKVNFADVIYYGDNANSPYGSKSIDEIKGFCLKIGEFLVDNRVDIMVVACNTATVAALEALKERFSSIPIIGVIEPGATAAVSKSKNKKIGVLSTPLTAKSDIYRKTILKMDSDIEVYQQGCENLCPMIEADWSSTEEELKELSSYLENIPKDVDTLVLGCTHYPLIASDIQKLYDGKIVDPAEETAKVILEELKRIIIEKNVKIKIREMQIDYFVSGDTQKFKKVGEKFMKEPIETIYRHN